jgi:multidrug efflux pump subunit AcrA (membrane-fusion protein)
MKHIMHCLLSIVFCLLILAQSAGAQAIELVPVVNRPVSRTIDLPGEMQPFLTVTLHARVQGYIENVLVDRGSVVKQGDLLVTLSAPEMKSQIAAAESRVQAAEADRLQAEGRLTSLEATLSSMQATLKAAQTTYDRLKKASETPGVVAGNELDVALQNVESQRAGIEAQRANIQSQRSSIDALRSKKLASEAELHALQEMESYLKVTAPFDGVVFERNVHPGALVGPSGSTPLLTLQQVSRLRLVVAVPEENVSGIVRSASVPFGVPAFPARVFTGTVARVPPALDVKTRSMAVELDVTNKDQALAPGMFATVHWPVRSTGPATYVPKTSVVTTTERTFVIRDKSGRAEWVNVQKGPAEGDLIRVIGALKDGDRVVKRATDEIREGMELKSVAK